MPQPAPRTAPLLCLASASPRRRELLAQIGVPHLVAAAHIDESLLAGEAAQDYVLRVARAKAQALAGSPRAQGLPVLAADTTVVVGGELLAKPAAPAEAQAMLGRLCGRGHTVYSAVALAWAGGLDTRLSATEVRMRASTPAERAAYAASGEPFDKAGGYAIQGFAAVFIEEIHGSYSGVMGLPLFETGELLRLAGIPYWNTMTA